MHVKRILLKCKPAYLYMQGHNQLIHGGGAQLGRVLQQKGELVLKSFLLAFFILFVRKCVLLHSVNVH